MSKIKLTKGELKRQRDSLSQFRHFLPTLQLKKQQLQLRISETRKELEACLHDMQGLDDKIKKWQGLVMDPQIEEGIIEKAIRPEKIDTELINVAGAKVPFLKEIIFSELEYDLFLMPFWLDEGLEKLKQKAEVIIKIKVIKERLAILSEELRITTQRVNLFEKIKIPECLDNIRRIRIYLGDQQANAVGISKVAKKKVDQRYSEEALV